MYIGTTEIDGKKINIQYLVAFDQFAATVLGQRLRAPSKDALISKVRSFLFHDRLSKSPSRDVYITYFIPVDKYENEWHNEQVTLYQCDGLLWMKQKGCSIEHAKRLGEYTGDSIDAIAIPSRIDAGGWNYTLMPPKFEEYNNRLQAKIENVKELVESVHAATLEDTTIETYKDAISKLDKIYDLLTSI